ncbi:hypothetical protein [Kitasatospora cineracea]|uniref:hypothetical protein n=1 Tax=Kitasatospora cineracea TaxID=88074 RepID=UPI0037990A9D
MHVELFADYFQILLLDESTQSSLSDAWTSEAVQRRLATESGLMGIWTEVNDDVDVSIHLLESRPKSEVGLADHVVEGSLEVVSGVLVVMGCTDYLPDAPRLTLPAGWFRVRVSKSNLEAVLSEDAESVDGQGEVERIVIDLWPEEYSEPKVLKKFEPDSAA